MDFSIPSTVLINREVSQQAEARKKPRTSENTRNKRFPFLSLPPELRNIVYGYVAEGCTATIAKHGTMIELGNPMPLSPQIDYEYRSVVALYAKTIKTDVYDFDFRHIVTFINHLSAAELSVMPDITGSNSKSSIVSLNFRPTNFEDDYLMRRWLNRTKHATKKGTKLDITYRLRTVQYRPMIDPNRARIIAWHSTLEKWRKVLDRFVLTSKNGRSKQESKKILAEFEREFRGTCVGRSMVRNQN
jgi:hypothetical protein